MGGFGFLLYGKSGVLHGRVRILYLRVSVLYGREGTPSVAKCNLYI